MISAIDKYTTPTKKPRTFAAVSPAEEDWEELESRGLFSRFLYAFSPLRLIRGQQRPPEDSERHAIQTIVEESPGDVTATTPEEESEEEAAPIPAVKVKQEEEQENDLEPAPVAVLAPSPAVSVKREPKQEPEELPAKGTQPRRSARLQKKRKSVSPPLLEENDCRWTAMYSQLRKYKTDNKKRGPSSKRSSAQSKWHPSQSRSFTARRSKRLQNKRNMQSKERAKSLEAIGFKWTVPATTAWDTKLAELMDYIQKNGNSDVDKSSKLGRWMQIQRRQFKEFKKGNRSFMTDEKVARLESIGFQWDP